MIGVANAGYRTIAIDCRGYGLSDQPLDPEKGCYADLVEDVVALLDALGIAKVPTHKSNLDLRGHYRDSETTQHC